MKDERPRKPCTCSCGSCGRMIDVKWTMCRPCALGWHHRFPCDNHAREPHAWHLLKTCRNCGVDSALHADGAFA